jgi:hypothetical protein
MVAAMGFTTATRHVSSSCGGSPARNTPVRTARTDDLFAPSNMLRQHCSSSRTHGPSNLPSSRKAGTRGLSIVVIRNIEFTSVDDL